MAATIVQTNNTPFNKVAIDPVTLDIIEGALKSARYEMDAVLFRSAMSPVIREQHDEFPMIANLDGIPAVIRSPANLDRIQSERARLQDDSVRISQELHREFFGGRLSNTGAGQWYAERKLEDLDALDELFRAEPDRRLLLMDMRSGERGFAA